MAILFDAPVKPGELTWFTREVPLNAENKLLTEAPSRFLNTNTINFGEIVKRNRTARYRSYDGRVHVSDRDSGTTSNVGLIPLSTSTNMGEYERLQLEFARTGGTNTLALAESIYDDATQLTKEVQARLEQAWGDVLEDGKLTVNENGLIGFEADFGVPANHKVTAGVLWSNTATSKVISDVTAWTDTYRVTNGVAPDVIRTSQTNVRRALRSAEVIAAVYGAAAGRTVARLVDLNDYLMNDGLPTFMEAYDTTVDVDGTNVRTIAENKVLLTPASLSALGETAWGVTATALELVKNEGVDLTFEQAAGITGVVVKNDGVPFRQFTYVDAAAIPVLSAPKRLFIASV